MNIRILENDLSAYKIIAGFETFEFTRAWNTYGKFKLKINANTPTADYLGVDKILYLDKYTTLDASGNPIDIDTTMFGYIEKVTIDKKTDKAREYIIVEGSEVKDHLNRLIYPDSSLVNDSYTNEYLETVIKSLIQKNASGTVVLSGVLTAATARQIPSVKVASDSSGGTQIDYSARYKNLSSELYSLLASQQMGLKVDIDVPNTDIIFDVAVGNDYTATLGSAGGIVLSLNTSTALQITDSDDRLNYRNLSVTAGLGEGASQTIEEVYSGSEPTGYDRLEVFTQAPDIESDDELPTRGAQKLSGLSETRSIKVKANELGSYQVGDDYDLGDYISIDTDTGLYDAQITKLKYKFSKTNPLIIDVILDSDIDDGIIKDIRAKHMDYDALGRASSSGSNLVSKKTVTVQGNTITFSSADLANLDDAFKIVLRAKNKSGNATAVPALRPNGSANLFDAVRSIVNDTRTSTGVMTPPSSSDWYYYASVDGVLGVIDDGGWNVIFVECYIDADNIFHYVTSFAIAENGLQYTGSYKGQGAIGAALTSLEIYNVDEFVVDTVAEIRNM